MLFSGMNCHNRTIDKPTEPTLKYGATWNEIHANSDAIDSALNAAFSQIAPQPIVAQKKKRPRRKQLEIVAPEGPNTFILKDTLNYE